MYWEDFTSVDLEILAAPEILERGLDYYRQGHVTATARLDQLLAGEVAGTAGIYQVRLWFSGTKVESSCSCPYQGFCKHLAALAIGWLENKAGFIDVREFLNRALKEPEKVPNLLEKLVFRNPLDFTRVVAADQAYGVKTLSVRGMINLVRNIFESASLGYDNLDALWEKAAGVKKLLEKELLAGNREALELLYRVLNGIRTVYLNNPQPEVSHYFKSIVSLLANLKGSFKKADLQELSGLVTGFYFDAALWEWKDELKVALVHLSAVDPDFIFNYIADRLSGNPESANRILDLISCYELLTVIGSGLPPKSAGNTGHYLENVTRQLTANGEGRLWLIDRMMNSDTEEAYRLTKEALVSGMEPKRSFRDRLIEIHWRRQGFRQAASLSFIQFQEEPNFEEYLRLKKILENHPVDLEDYLKRIRFFLDQQGYNLLLFKIAMDQKNCAEVIGRLGVAQDDPALLLATADFLCENGSPETVAAFPNLIQMLLREQTTSFWNAALRVAAGYKKLCHQWERREEWEQFRTRLQAEYDGNSRFRVKFGSILKV